MTSYSPAASLSGSREEALRIGVGFLPAGPANSTRRKLDNVRIFGAVLRLLRAFQFPPLRVQPSEQSRCGLSNRLVPLSRVVVAHSGNSDMQRITDDGKCTARPAKSTARDGKNAC